MWLLVMVGYAVASNTYYLLTETNIQTHALDECGKDRFCLEPSTVAESFEICKDGQPCKWSYRLVEKREPLWGDQMRKRAAATKLDMLNAKELDKMMLEYAKAVAEQIFYRNIREGTALFCLEWYKNDLTLYLLKPLRYKKLSEEYFVSEEMWILEFEELLYRRVNITNLEMGSFAKRLDKKLNDEKVNCTLANSMEDDDYCTYILVDLGLE